MKHRDMKSFPRSPPESPCSTSKLLLAQEINQSLSSLYGVADALPRLISANWRLRRELPGPALTWSDLGRQCQGFVGALPLLPGNSVSQEDAMARQGDTITLSSLQELWKKTLFILK